MTDQEQALKEQKANCIFCKIQSGEIPGKTVYEDDTMSAILDIRPAAKGHTLVMPKEHYPIMPLIPPEEFAHLFGRAAALSKAVRDGALAERCITFIANGGIAGQQSPHFLFHLIPREKNDGLDVLDIPQKSVEQADIKDLISQNMYAVMKEHLQKIGKMHLLAQEKPQETAPPENVDTVTEPAPEASQTVDLGAISQMIEDNPDIKQILLEDPERLKRIIAENPNFQQLFGNVDIDILSQQMRARLAAEPQEQSSEEHVPSNTSDEVVPAAKMSMNELFAFIDGKPKLREIILEKPESLPDLIAENPRVAQFFEGSDVDMIVHAYTRHAEKQKQPREPEKIDDGEKPDLDRIAEMFK